jgi:hypothetical protein
VSLFIIVGLSFFSPLCRKRKREGGEKRKGYERSLFVFCFLLLRLLLLALADDDDDDADLC